MELDKLNDDLDKAIKDNDFQKVSNVLTQMWLITQFNLVRTLNPELKEFTFMKTPIEVNNGKYLLMLIHVDGEKIKLGESNE